MSIIDSTDIIETAISHKSSFEKNFDDNNYYFKTLQQKIDREWNYRPNIAVIKREVNKVVAYSNLPTGYEDMEAVLQTVHGDRGEKLGDDWREAVFRDLKFPAFLGQRFKFPLDFRGFSEKTPQEQEDTNSIWLAVNRNSINATNSLLLRRCNSNIGFVGSPSLNYLDITEYHYEPVVLETELKYINLYYNKVLTVPQAEIYATMQYNYYTQNVKVNDRFVIGDTDLINKENNMIFKVKAVNRFFSQSTYGINTNLSLSDVPLVVIAMDRDTLSTDDNLVDRVATRTTMYLVSENNEEIKEDEDVEPIISNKRLILFDKEKTSLSLNRPVTYTAKIFDGEVEIENEVVNFEVTIENNNLPILPYLLKKNKNSVILTATKICPNVVITLKASWIDEQSNMYEDSVKLNIVAWG